MKLQGILDFSLGNFLCLRGYAPMGELYEHSEPDDSYQRDLIKDHKEEMVSFLDDGEYTFFPEVVLAATLSTAGEFQEEATRLYESTRKGESLGRGNLHFSNFSITYTVNRTKSKVEGRQQDIVINATLLSKGFSLSAKKPFKRIDGNHRLSATPEKEKFGEMNTPFCLILFRDEETALRFATALFHNINYKQVPLTMEQNLKLILDNEELFTNETLKKKQSFGWAYYFARLLFKEVDLDMVSSIEAIIRKEPRSFYLRQTRFLLESGKIKEKKAELRKVKQAFTKCNEIIAQDRLLKEECSKGVMSALLYYCLAESTLTQSFLHWIKKNHLHKIELEESDPFKTQGKSFVQIFDQIIKARKRTIFVSMQFNDDRTEGHYQTIERVVRELNNEFNLSPEIAVQRVDYFHDGTSYSISDKIIEMMSDCGLLIGNLTLCNPNVYHEIGFVMGKAKAEGKDVADMLLFLDENESTDSDVAFNLKGIKQLRFTQPEVFANGLKVNLKESFKLR